MTQVLAIEQLDVTIDNNNILSDINLVLNSGEILGLVGASGCGKTTLLNTIAGFIRFNQGCMQLAQDITVSHSHFVEPEDRQIGMIFQDYALFPHLTVTQNIAFGLNKLDKATQTERVTKLLSLLKLEDYAERYPHQLSGGQQQRVAIARALAPQPKLLLLDEPFSNIDARLRHELMLEIRQLLKQLHISAIFVTHNKDEVFTFADKMAVMNKGQLLQVGEPTTLCQSPTSWLVADFLQLGSWIPCHVEESVLETSLGTISNTDTSAQLELNEQGIAKLLIKPQHIVVESQKAVNAEVVHIGVTEQGFHYQLDSLERDNSLAFTQLSFYSEQVFQLGQKLALSIKPHQLLVFKE